MAARKRRRKGRRKGGRRWKAWLLYGAIMLLALAAGWLLWVDYRLREDFAALRWSVPARVYARPLELYPGARVGRRRVLEELRALGYRQTVELSRPGRFRIMGKDALVVRTRGYHAPEGRIGPRTLRLRFEGERITGLQLSGGSRRERRARLEPVLIAKIVPRLREDREVLKLEEVPEFLIEALVAVEDRHFFSHFGIDPIGIVRALWANLRSGRVVQGGSTITQQLVKNLYLDRQRTLGRKLQEAVMALLLELHFHKQEILETYLNAVFLGQDGARAIHGFGEASRFYFGMPISELNGAQMALLVGMVKGPSLYNPRRHPRRARQRRDQVLQLLVGRGLLSPAQGRVLQAAPLGVIERPLLRSRPYAAFVGLVRRQLASEYDESQLREAGLRIFTTLDPAAQRLAVRALGKRLRAWGRKKDTLRGLQGAVVIADARNGDLLALVGGRDDAPSGFNRALDARRPIGSLVKPAVYLTALQQSLRYTPITLIDDAPVRWKSGDGRIWSPANYDGRSHGPVPLYRALANSYNQATVRLGREIGIDRVGRTLRRMGVTGRIPQTPSLLLGTVELSPLQVTRMYLSLASGGMALRPRAIIAVTTDQGRPLRRYRQRAGRVFSSAEVGMMNFLLGEVVRSGTARWLRRRLPGLLPLAGKTGTTDDLRDSWFAGYGRDLLGVVWIGRDDNRPAGLSGSSGALRVWGDVMAGLRPQPLRRVEAEGLLWLPVLEGRYLSEPDCPGAREFPFLEPLPRLPRKGCGAAPVVSGTAIERPRMVPGFAR